MWQLVQTHERSQKVPLGEAALLQRQAAEEAVGPRDMHRVLLDQQQPYHQVIDASFHCRQSRRASPPVNDTRRVNTGQI
jgi:hypothetical protein